MSWAVKLWVAKQRLGSPLAKAVLYSLADFAGDNGHFTASIDSVERDTELAVGTVRQILNSLEKSGWIVCADHGGKLVGQILFFDLGRTGSAHCEKPRLGRRSQ